MGGFLKTAIESCPRAELNVAAHPNPHPDDALGCAPAEHARFTRATLLRVLLIGAAMWGITMAILVITVGFQGPLTQSSWFFTKAAVLTFGGAYAVLPHVHQGAVATNMPIPRNRHTLRRRGLYQP